MTDQLGSKLGASGMYEGALEQLLDRVDLQEAGEYPSPWSAWEWDQVACPQPTQVTVSRFPRYQQSIRSLPFEERAQIRNVAHTIVNSFKRGCQPLNAVRLVGHADRDVQRGPAFERKISIDRALAVEQALRQLISNPVISSGIAWYVSGVGADRLVVPNPRTELERARNRRVEIWLNGQGPGPSGPNYIRWAQACLNQVLGTRLALTGVMEPRTRSALRSFQQQRGLMVNGLLNSQTLAALIATCGFPQIRPATVGWPDAPTSGAATRESNITVPTAGWNSGKVQVGRIDRLPLDGLTTANAIHDHEPAGAESPVQRAIALKPYYLDEQNTTIDVLLHLHGFNVGYRQRKAQGRSECTKTIGSVRDIDCDRVEKQLETWGFSAGSGNLRIRGERLIAVLAQGTNRSNFGSGAEGMFLDPNAYLTEVFRGLQSVLPQGARPGRTILSAHSGGGRPLSKMLDSGNVPSNLSMVIIFDAINDDVQLSRYTGWVLSQIRDDISSLAGRSEGDQLAYLSRSMRFRGYYSDSDFYQRRYRLLDRSITSFLRSVATVPPLASQRALDALIGNYRVIKVGGEHDGIIGNPTPVFRGARPLEVALATFSGP